MQGYSYNPHNAVEIPLPKHRISVSRTVVMIISILLIASGFFIFFFTNPAENIFEKYKTWIIAGLSVIFVLSPLSEIISPFIEMSRLKKVCTVQATGTLVGYAQRHNSSEGTSDYTYAPKYDIYINGHHEIRTLDDFSRRQNNPPVLELLVNPDGYEIMNADGKLSRSGKMRIISGVIFLIFIGIAVCFILKENPNLFN